MQLLTFTQEQNDLRGAVRKVLADLWSPTRRRAWVDGDRAYDKNLWTALAEGLGVNGLMIDEEHGGLGCTFAEQSVVLEELGRAAVALPYLSSAVIAPVVLAAGETGPAERWLPRLASGDAVAALAHTEDGGDWRGSGPATTATAGADGWIVSGVKNFVVDGAVADLLLVAATSGSDGSLVLLAVDASSPGVSVQDLPTLDLTGSLATVRLDGAGAQLVASGDRAREILDAALDVAAAGLACEQAGGSATALELTVDYVKVREQFGVPIGSFQAVKFACADMLLDLEAARSAAYYAAAALATGADDAAVSTAVAKAVCSDAYTAITGSMIQLHGGVGYTWEHDAHLYFKRAKATQHLYGDPESQRARLADLVGV